MADQSSSASGDRPADFKEHVDYSALMGGGRRKPAIPVGGPAITRHVAFWVPRDLALKHQDWVEQVEQFCLTLYKHLKEKGYDPQTRSLRKSGTNEELYLLNHIRSLTDAKAIPKEIEGQATRYQMFRLRFFYGSLPVHVDLELHDEYFTLSTTLDLAGWGKLNPAGEPKRESSFEEHREAVAKLVENIQQFDKTATKHYGKAKIGKSKRIKDKSREDFQTPYEQIYDKIWESLQKDIFTAPYNAIGEANLGGKFVDFRGFVATAGDKAFINDPGTYKPKSSAALRIGKKYFGSRNSVNRADALLAWLKADKGFDANNDDREVDRTEPVEFTITNFLRYRAMYATVLGAQLSRKRGEKGPLQGPVTYMMLARNQAPGQLGRLINRIHTLGTLRLAALYDFQHLVRAGYELRLLDPKLDKRVGARLLGTLGSAKTAPEILRTAASQLFHISAQLTRVGLQASKKDVPQIAGGLAHRVERSDFYRKQFEAVVKDLREDRIEGFPQYSEAVNRRLGGIYQLLDVIGDRFTRLQDKVMRITEQLRATQTLQMQDAIRAQTVASVEVQKAIQKETDASLAVQDQIRQQTETSGKLQGLFLKLQESVDYVFFLVPFPYYLSSLMLKPFSPKFLEDHPVMEWVAVGGSVLSGVMLAHRDKLKETRLGQYSVNAFTWATDKAYAQIPKIISAKNRFKQCAIEIGQRTRRWPHDQAMRIKASGQRIAASTSQQWQRAKAVTQRTKTRVTERVTVARRKIREFIGRPPPEP